jgi:hypothetical protein
MRAIRRSAGSPPRDRRPRGRVVLASELAPAALDRGWCWRRRHAQDAVGIAAETSSLTIPEATTRIVGGLRLPFQPPLEPMLAKLSADLPDGRRLAVRAQVGRLPGDRLPRRRRGLHPEPRPQAARALLPRAAAGAARQPARALRGRRRDRHPRRGRARLRRAAAAHPPGRLARAHARRADAGLVRRWDLLALGDDDLRGRPQAERRELIERELAAARRRST